MSSMPKIGIRPAIDGRRKGIRESLEVQTMNMAKAAAALITKNLRHPNGEKVECVIADTTIGGVAEAAACAEKFQKNNVMVSLTVSPCWCYGSETMDMDPLTPKAVWGFNGTERPGAVYLAAVLAAHSQKGLPAFGIYGRDVQPADAKEIPADVQEKILRFARAGLAAAYMRGKSYLSIGSVAMGIAGSIVEPDFFEEYLGMRCESVDSTEILRRMDEGIYDKEEFKRALAWTKKYCKQGADIYNPNKTGKTKAQQEAIWEFVVKMTMIGRDLMIGNPKLAKMGFVEESCGHNAIAGGFQGQRQWTDWKPNGDFMETILNTSFDWNGPREPLVLATENDSCNGVAMLFGHLLTGLASGFSDVRTYWSPAAIQAATGKKLDVPGLIHLINSGATTLDATGQATLRGKPVMKFFKDMTDKDMKACLAACEWVPANLGYFRGGGFSSHFVTKGGMPITMHRLNRIKGLGPVLQIAEGYTAEIPAKIHSILDKRTDPGWPTTWFIPRLTGKGAFKDVYSVMANWGANHGAFNYGHIGADLITLASILRIPVCMHNVDEDAIFRPSAWNAFGMDKEGADYRACANFGPLYR